ncbi:MAG: hypothetical protein VX460_12045 [Planctomycetota bacterium]|nr:hypothetical protein [Planctomycetota bacterium]
MADRADRLAREEVHGTTPRALALLLVGVALAVLAVNALAVRLSPASERTYDGMIVERKWRLAQEGAPDGGVIVIGDSSGNFAVDGAVLSEALGVPVVNLCAYGRFQVGGAAWFLDEALRAGGEPAMVVVVLGSRTFALDPGGAELAQVPIAPFEWSSRLPRAGLDAGRAAAFLRARALPLFDQAPSFEASALSGRWQVDPAVLRVEPDGTTRLPRAYPEGVEPFARRLLEELAAVQGPVPSERERRAVRGLVADAEARGYDLVFVDGPIWEGLAEDPEHAAFLERVHGFLDEACAGSERARRLDVPLQTFPAAELENPFHVVPDAARRFSARLAGQLAGR